LKKFAKFQKFINLLQGNKLLCNVKTWWISTLSPTKQIYLEYHPFIVIRMQKVQKNDGAKKILNSLCDVEVILRLSYIFPLLECVHA
jgi:hypothetical protein